MSIQDGAMAQAPGTGAEISVERLADGQIRVVKGTWSDVFPEERRLTWADWYDGMFQTYSYAGYALMARLLRDLPPPSGAS